MTDPPFHALVVTNFYLKDQNSSSFFNAQRAMTIQSTKYSKIPALLANPFKRNDYFSSVYKENNQSCLELIFLYRTNTFNSNFKF